MAWSEAERLSLGYACEQRTHLRAALTYRASVEADPDAEAHLRRRGDLIHLLRKEGPPGEQFALAHPGGIARTGSSLKLI